MIILEGLAKKLDYYESWPELIIAVIATIVLIPFTSGWLVPMMLFVWWDAVKFFSKRQFLPTPKGESITCGQCGGWCGNCYEN